MPNGKTLRQMFAEHPASEGLRGKAKWEAIWKLSGKTPPGPYQGVDETIEGSWVDALPPAPELDTVLSNDMTRRQVLKKLESLPPGSGLSGDEKWKALRAAANRAGESKPETPPSATGDS